MSEASKSAQHTPGPTPAELRREHDEKLGVNPEAFAPFGCVPSIEDLLALAVADFLRDHERSVTRQGAASRVNEYAARIGITPAVALARYSNRAAIAKAIGASS